MASIKLLHYTKKVYTDGTSPVILQIISGKKIKRKVLFSVTPEQWNDKDKRVKKHNNAPSFNEKIIEEKAKYEKIVLTLSKDADIDNIFNSDTPPKEKEKRLPSFFDIAAMYLEEIKLQSGFSYKNFNAVIEKFRTAIKNDKLRLSEIDSTHVNAFIRHMSLLGNGPSTQNLNIRVLRFVSNYAKRNKLDSRPEELHDFKLPQKKGSTIKRKLTAEELKRFSEVTFRKGGDFSKMCQDAFMLSIYLRGKRVSDMILLKQENIRNGRFVDKDMKTETEADVKLVPPAQEIVNRYLDGREYLFRFFNWEPDPSLSPGDNNVKLAQEIKRITSNINNRLQRIAKRAGIDKTVRTHIARHTLAKMVADAEPDRRKSMKIVGHKSLAVHEVYITDVTSTEDLDNTMDNIFK